MTCNNCIHGEMCAKRNKMVQIDEHTWDEYELTYNVENLCEHFKNKTDYAEVKHGRWQSEMRERCDWKGRKQQYYQPNSCSVCHEAVVERTPYCPWCGAQMDGRRDT